MKMPKCPNPSGTRYVEMPFQTRVQIVVPAGGCGVLTLAPYNECVGSVVVGTTQGFSGSPTVTQSYIYDRYLSSLFNAGTAGGALTVGSRELSRCIEFCAEINYVGVLTNTAGVARMYKWQSGNLPHLTVSGAAGAPTAATMAAVYNTIMQHDDATHIANASMLTTKCTHAAMLARQSLEFEMITPEGYSSTAGGGLFTNNVPAATYYTPSNWVNTYSAPGTPLLPWSPLLLVFDASSTTGLTYELVIKGKMQILPPPDQWFERLASFHPTDPILELEWWKFQRSVLKQRFHNVAAGSLSSAPVGIVNEAILHAKSKQKAKRKAKGPLPPPAPKGNSMVKAAIDAAGKSLLGTAVSKAAATVAGEIVRRQRQGRNGPRGQGRR